MKCTGSLPAEHLAMTRETRIACTIFVENDLEYGLFEDGEGFN
jgi:hypothetical protein